MSSKSFLALVFSGAVVILFIAVVTVLLRTKPQTTGAAPADTKPALTTQKPAAKPEPASEPQKPTPPQETVYNSAWDGSVLQVKFYLEDRLNDAKSVEYVDWSPVKKDGDRYYVRCKYRAKNAFGAYVLANQLFQLDLDGKVLSVVDFAANQ